MGAMTRGNTEIVKILLDCHNIKLDTQDRAGNTALHYACLSNQVESVKLFLAHPSCTKEVARIMNNMGRTAEMLGNKECARLVRDFTGPLEEDDRDVDDLVEFITGKKEEKKRRKKRKNPGQSVTHTGNNKTTTNIHEKRKNHAIKNETIDELDTVGKISDITIAQVDFRNHSEISIYNEVPVRLQCTNASLEMSKADLQKKIAEKHLLIDKNKQDVKDISSVKSGEIENIAVMIKKSQDEKWRSLDKVDKLNKDLSDLETKMAELKLTKAGLLEQSKKHDERIQEYKYKKHRLENNFEMDMKIKEERENAIKDDILDLESKSHEVLKTGESLPNDQTIFFEQNKEFLQFINNQISEKETELECPVCLEVACSPIFMCSEQHLICSTCRPKLSNCPECREGYGGQDRRHRYAEKTAEELKRLREKKEQVRQFS